MRAIESNDVEACRVMSRENSDNGTIEVVWNAKKHT